MERKFDGMTKDEIIDAIAKEIDFLPDEMKKIMIYASFNKILQ
ncbi:MAG: hypothetical protein ACOWWR_08165 [Eubacteriales bacterium]